MLDWESWAVKEDLHLYKHWSGTAAGQTLTVGIALGLFQIRWCDLVVILAMMSIPRGLIVLPFLVVGLTCLHHRNLAKQLPCCLKDKLLVPQDHNGVSPIDRVVGIFGENSVQPGVASHFNFS